MSSLLPTFIEIQNYQVSQKGYVRNIFSHNPLAPWHMYCTKWNLQNLSYNKGLGILEKFITKSWLEDVFYKTDEWDWYGLSKNTSLPWSDSFVFSLKEHINWSSLSQNLKFPWNMEFILKYSDQLDWKHLSANPSLPWSSELIEYFIDRWDWKNLSLNNGIPWTKELINEYKNSWNWDMLSEFGVPWNEKLLKYFQNLVNWKLLSYNHNLNIECSTILKYKDKFDILSLLTNKSVKFDKWDFELIDLYFNKLPDGYKNNRHWIELLNNEKIYNELFAKFITPLDFNDIIDYITNSTNYFKHERSDW